MKNKTFFALFILLLFSFTVSAQVIIITPAKTVYRRPKPISSYKRTFTVIRPKIKGPAPAIAKKIESAVSYEKNLELNIKEEQTDAQWLEEASYKVDYSAKGILSMTLTVEGSAAYPDSSSKSVVVDVKTGSRITVQDVFTNLAGLAAKAKEKQKAEIKKGLIDINKAEPGEDNNNLFESADFTAENLSEFEVGGRGVTFLYDYGFPHVIEAMQPDGRYFFTWAQLKPYIKQGGLFAQFIR
jgi:hypothetical protein